MGLPVAHRRRARRIVISFAALIGITGAALQAEDWPEWRGKGRLGVWTETGILERFPDTGLTYKWRVPINRGYAGPAVAAGRVFVTDSRPTGKANAVIERALCLDEKTGEILWVKEWGTDYTGLQLIYAIGPRATPTVDGDRVYVVGATGNLFALDVRTGNVLWQKDYLKDYGASLPVWGVVGAPLVDGDRLICLLGGEPDAKVVAFDKVTGKEIWRSLSSDSEPGYNSPIIIEAGGTRQLIIWHTRAIASLDPATGKVYWEVPFEVGMGLTVATPVHSGSFLIVSTFYHGSRMLKLDDTKPGATLLWKGNSDNELTSDGLHSLISTPVILGGYIYGICSFGQLRCLEAKTGKRIWETQAVTKEKARQVTAFLVRQGDRYFINNDRGELIIAKLSPGGYQEISRTQLIEPTHPVARRREQGPVVNWSHPAYANKHIFARNDKEILCASLAKE